jgi:MFS family permease
LKFAPPPFGELLNRNFLLVWSGYVLAIGAQQASGIAGVFWLKHATGSASLVGLLGMLTGLAAILASPIGGVLSDRLSRAGILSCTGTTVGFLMAALGVTLWAGLRPVGALVAILIVVCTLAGACRAFAGPTFSALVPDIVPPGKLTSANSFIQASAQVAGIAGLATGGAFYEALGAPLLFLSSGVASLFLAFNCSLLCLPRGPRAAADGGSSAPAGLQRDVLEGVKYVWSSAGLKALVTASSALSFFSVPVLLLLPFFVEDILNLSPQWYGYFAAFYGFGSLLGLVGAGVLRPSGARRAHLVIAFVVANSLGYTVLGLFRSRALIALLFLAGGMLGGFVSVTIISVLQAGTPARLRGRVFGVLNTLGSCVAPLGMGLAGVAADVLDQDIPLLYVICGSCMATTSLLLAFSRGAWEFLAGTVPEASGLEAAQALPREVPSAPANDLYGPGS